MKVTRLLLLVGTLLAARSWANHDPNTFNEATLNAPGCNLCVTTFAYNFPTTSGFGPFGIAFYPGSKKVVVSTSSAPGKMFVFPALGDPAVLAPGCPTGPAGFDASLPAYSAGFTSAPLGPRGVYDMAFGLDGTLYATGDPGYLVKLSYNPVTNTFTVVNPVIDTGSFAAGMGTDQVSGAIIYQVGNQIRSYDPISNAITVLVPGGFQQADGVTVEKNGARFWVADIGANVMLEFAITRVGSGPPTGATGPTVLCSALPGADGIAKGLDGTCLQGKIFCNTNGGVIVQHDGSGCSNFISGGSRGDFVKVSCNGWLYATQSSSIALIRENSSAPVFEPQCGFSCDNLVNFVKTRLAGCISGNRLNSLETTCAKLQSGPPSAAVNTLTSELGRVCNELSSNSNPACVPALQFVGRGLANLLQDLTGQPAQSFVPAGCNFNL
jgi:hypothetical protein